MHGRNCTARPDTCSGRSRRLPGAADDGARHLWLETQDVNCEAIAFYERLGFAIVGVDRSLYPPPIASEVAIFMARDVR